MVTSRSASGPPAAAGRDLVGFARGGGLNLVSAVISQAALLGITIVMVRLLGRREVGLYAQAFAFLVLLGLLSLSGLRAGLIRFVAVHLADQDEAAVHGTSRLGVAISTGGALVLGVALVLLAPAIVHAAFSDDGLITPLRFVGVALPAATFTDAALSATQGFRTTRPYALVGMVFEPLTRFTLTCVLLAAGLGLRGAMAALVVSNYVAAALAFLALRRLLGPRPDYYRYQVRELLGFSSVSWFTSLASSGLVWADTILLGVYRTSAEVGVYSVATRLVTLATFVATPIGASLAPRIALLYTRRAMVSLSRAYTAATSWIVRLLLPASIVLIVFSSPLLGLFGPAYRVGAQVAAVLVIGKFLDSAAGPCGVVLNQSGRSVLSMIDNIGALALNIALNVWLIPDHGILGAAVAWQVSLIALNAVRILEVWVLLRMLPVNLSVAKGLLAGAASLVACIVVRDVLPSPFDSILGIATAVFVYVGVLVALGFAAEDRVILRELLRPTAPAPTVQA